MSMHRIDQTIRDPSYLYTSPIQSYFPAYMLLLQTSDTDAQCGSRGARVLAYVAGR